MLKEEQVMRLGLEDFLARRPRGMDRDHSRFGCNVIKISSSCSSIESPRVCMELAKAKDFMWLYQSHTMCGMSKWKIVVMKKFLFGTE